MKNPTEINHPLTLAEAYSGLEIHPNLQEHMLWVAGLAKLIVDNWKDSPLDEDALVQACLFHDAAKLIKFKTFDEGNNHWEQVRQEYIERYGNSEHEATVAICRLAGVSEKAIDILETKNINPFVERARYIAGSDNFALKILAYCDSRVAPGGLTTLQGRYAELLTRDTGKVEDREAMELFLEIERQIQAHLDIDLSAVSQEQVNEQGKSLLSLEI